MSTDPGELAEESASEAESGAATETVETAGESSRGEAAGGRARGETATDGEDVLAVDAGTERDDGGFVWCTASDGTEPTTEAATAETTAADAAAEAVEAADTGPAEPTGTAATDSGFEWCDPTDEPDAEPTAADSAGEATVETTSADPTEEEFVVRGDLVTTTRSPGTDDEAVALLTSLRRRPDDGRWRRAAAELGDDE
ncbi:hypothetical protein [Salinigranum salinum]|uniref:hypothetical protein n=1 Tax=Salinigranum salinum TaxID=1364937 RepID=UPI00126133E2|nr:hypothetical protein [Salinigranum salinum]